MGTKPKKVDDQGRCCGRKPIRYKRPFLHSFCPRCNAEFNPDGEQTQNWAWEPEGDGFAATYPSHDYAKDRRA